MKDINLMSIGELNIFINQATEKVESLKNKKVIQQVNELMDLGCDLVFSDSEGDMEFYNFPWDTTEMYEEGYISVKDAIKLLPKDDSMSFQQRMITIINCIDGMSDIEVNTVLSRVNELVHTV